MKGKCALTFLSTPWYHWPDAIHRELWTSPLDQCSIPPLLAYVRVCVVVVRVCVCVCLWLCVSVCVIMWCVFVVVYLIWETVIGTGKGTACLFFSQNSRYCATNSSMLSRSWSTLQYTRMCSVRQNPSLFILAWKENTPRRVTGRITIPAVLSGCV